MKTLTDHRVKDFQVYLLANYQSRISIKQIAEKLELTPRHLSKLFKEVFGIPPAVYVRELRLRESCRLLETSFLQVKQICYQVGFNDQSNFIRYFKAKYGCTPLEFRNRSRGR